MTITTAAADSERLRVTPIPLLPCRALDDVLPFYAALGFEVTTRQGRPNPYAATRWRGIDLHFHALAGFGAERAGNCLMIVPEVEALHESFRQALRAESLLPSKGTARISRMKPGQTRFTTVDPAGNSVIFIRRGEPDPHAETRRLSSSLSPLGKAIRAAVVLRDFKNDDSAARSVLKRALAKATGAEADERARAEVMLAELEAHSVG